MPENQIEYIKPDCDQNSIFMSEEEMRESLSNLCYGDLYVIGQIWIQALRAGLVGSEWTFVPVVKAAPAEKPVPPKPPPMRYKDLPIYKSPHYEYKDYVEDESKCPKKNVRLMHEYLYPHVSAYRKSICNGFREFNTEIKSFKKDICCALNHKKNDFKNYMRCPENLVLRQAVVAMGGFAGFCVGYSKGIPSKIFFTGLGLLSAGALCFPKETDEAFRTFSYHSGKTVIAIYNFYCNQFFSMRERIPCSEDMPPQTPEKKPFPCPVKK